MKVILIEDVARVGKKGEVINTKQGYFRNYLLPNNLAVVADKENLKKLEESRQQEREEEAQNRKLAQETKEKIEKAPVTVKVKTGEEGKLFGSVTNKDIAKALEEKSIVVDKKKISVDEEIAKTGEYSAKIKLFTDVIADVKLIVEAL